MICIKTQNIPLESFSLVKGLKANSETATGDFTSAFKEVLSEHSEEANIEFEKHDQEWEEFDASEQELTWFTWSQMPSQLKEAIVLSDEANFQESLKKEVTSQMIGSPIETLQMNPSDESLIDPLAIQNMETPKKMDNPLFNSISDVISKTHPLDESKTPSNTESEKSVADQPFTTFNVSEEHSLLQALQQKNIETETSHEISDISLPYEITDEVESTQVVKQSTDTGKALLSKDKELQPKPIEIKIDFNPFSEEKAESKAEQPLMIKEKGTQEMHQNSNRLDDMETELPVEETKNPQFERGIEQLRSLRMVKPENQVSEKLQISEHEWVSKVESFVVEQLEAIHEVESSSSARIQLTPEHLGEMEVELLLKDRGLQAKLFVEHPETKDWLEQKVAELTTKLALQNIEVEDFQVTVGKQNQHFLGAEAQEQSFTEGREQDGQRKRPFNYTQSEEQEVPVLEQKYDSKTGRLSLWV